MNKYIDNLLERTDKFVIGVSGGVDSVLLLDNLVEKYKNKIVVAHVNHGFREESIEEYSFVENLCNSYGVKFIGCTLDVNKYKLDNNISSDESAARDLRYEFYSEVMAHQNTKYLMLGHHGDDLVEGVLMRLVSGANGKGLISMTKVHELNEGMVVIRPLLEMSKDEIYEEANNRCLVWREDITNKENNYTRNRYRNNLLPFLKNENNNVHRNILKFSEIKSEEEDYFDSVVLDNIKNKILSEDGIYKIDKDYWNNENVVIKRRMLAKILNNLGLHYSSIYTLEMLEEKIGGKFNTNYNLLVKGVYVVDTKYYFYLISDLKKNELENINSNDNYIEVDGCTLFKGKKVNKIFKDRKVPVAFRKYIILDGEVITDVLGNVIYGD